MQSDVRVGVSSARIGFAGPAVILNTMYEMNQTDYDAACPSDFQTAEYLRDHGQLDIVIPASDGANAKDIYESTVVSILKVLQPKSNLSMNLEGLSEIMSLTSHADHMREKKILAVADGTLKVNAEVYVKSINDTSPSSRLYTRHVRSFC